MLLLNYLMGSLLYLHFIAAMLLLHLFYVDFSPGGIFVSLALIPLLLRLSKRGTGMTESMPLLDTAPSISDIYTRFHPVCSSK